jgi:hypothetical protein
MSSQLQTLSDQFNAILTQYTNTYQEYITLVNSNDNSLTTVPNSSFFSQRYINTINNSTLDADFRKFINYDQRTKDNFYRNLANAGLGNINQKIQENIGIYNRSSDQQRKTEAENIIKQSLQEAKSSGVILGGKKRKGKGKTLKKKKNITKRGKRKQKGGYVWGKESPELDKQSSIISGYKSTSTRSHKRKGTKSKYNSS